MSAPASPSARPEARRYVLDPGTRRLDGGRALLGGSPLRLFRLTDAGVGLVGRIERGEAVAVARGAARLVDRLVDAGLLHPVAGPARRFTMSDVTVVIPVRDRDPAPTIASVGPVGAVVVVDDGSAEPIEVALPGVSVVRHDTSRGPGAARNAGLAHARTPVVAFVDSDVTATPGWLDSLLAHLDDDRVGLAAPRVATEPGTSVLGRYEAARSPLDLGAVPARVRARTRVGYVPAAALVVRAAAAREVGGFDAALHVGEDVDFVWRLDEAGWGVRYEPASVVTHEHRATLRATLRRRFEYGTSAGPLARRHPGALAPVAVSGWSALAWALAVLARRPVAGALVAGATTRALARKLGPLPDAEREAWRIAGRGHLFAGRQLAEAVVRPWWPLAALAAWRCRRLRVPLAVAAVAPKVAEWRQRRPALGVARWVALRLADDAAYSSGVWVGAAAARTLGPLRPDLASWPRPGRKALLTGHQPAAATTVARRPRAVSPG